MIEQSINQVAVDHLLMRFAELKFKTIKIGNETIKIITNSSCYNLFKSFVNNHKDSNVTLTQEIGLNSPSDLTPGVYEGGFKVWECSRDMVDFIQNNLQLTGKINCLDLGCGSGIVGINLLKSTEASVDFQDFNENVLINYTLPNILVNLNHHQSTISETWTQLSPRINLISGDWSKFPLTARYDYIFSCETIYNQDNYPKLADILINCLTINGIAYFAAKSYYFGVGGGAQEFKNFLQDKQLTVEEVAIYPDCVERIIMKITRKEDS